MQENKLSSQWQSSKKECIVMKFSYMSTTPCINQSLYIVERIISIPGTQSNAPILTRAPPGTKLQSNSNYKSQDSSDYTWSSALKRRAMKNCKKSRRDIHFDKLRIYNVPWYILGRPQQFLGLSVHICGNQDWARDPVCDTCRPESNATWLSGWPSGWSVVDPLGHFSLSNHGKIYYRICG